MTRAPSFQFYPDDWLREMLGHTLELKGAWTLILCKMWWEPERGKMTRTIEEWARTLGVSKRHATNIIHILQQKKVADFHEKNGELTLINRRMYRDYLDQLNGRERYRRYKNKRKTNGETNAELTASSSSSLSSSSSIPPMVPPRGTRHQNKHLGDNSDPRYREQYEKNKEEK